MVDSRRYSEADWFESVMFGVVLWCCEVRLWRGWVRKKGFGRG